MRSYQEIFPREGAYIDPIAHIIKKTLLHPVFTLSVLGYLKLSISNWPSLQSLALYGAIFSVALWLNELLSRNSANNWCTDSTYDWKKEIVLVTGGSSGIGASVVKRLVEDGVRVVVLDVAPMPSDMESKFLTYYRCDLSDECEIRNICIRVREEVGHPTVLINNAGLSRGKNVAETTYNDISITIRTNLLAPFLLTREFIPNMIQRNHGHIVNIASMSAYLPPAGLADYGATKAGLIAFHESLGLELKLKHAAPKVRTSLAVLSFTKTPLFKGETNQSSFLFPLIHVDTVGDAIVDTLYSGYSRTIFLPGIFRFFAGIRGAPEWFQDMIRQGSKSLKVDFKGRQEIDSKTGKLI
ncbi:hypothetical protein N7456_000199 [Penicillium angulare]|uniref:Uncharacterized protein n=1 Tax=Penicillium angulare TaxID=116970 RepID=A0A9W9GC43_9EURO|nr:hypothetical protein N7456_000199 [Penicillium angulare]